MQVLIYKFPMGWSLRRPKLWFAAFPCMMHAQRADGNLKVAMLNREGYMIAYTVWGSGHALQDFMGTTAYQETLEDLKKITSFDEFLVEYHSVPADDEVEQLALELSLARHKSY